MASTNRRMLTGDDEDKIGDAYETESLLNNDSDQDEDTVFNNPRRSTETVEIHGKLDSIKIQIREVTDVMRSNVQKVMERGDNLEDLQLASERLNMAGTEFRNSARKARYEGWLKNFLAKFGIIGIIVGVFVIILVTTIVKYS